MAYVRLTDAAIEDLKRLKKHNPSSIKQIIKKMLLLEANPHAGEPLIGALIKWRKLTVGDRTWRIIWIPKTDSNGEQVVEIAEIWAVGARSDAEIYDEVKERINSLPASPHTTSLADVIELLGKTASGLQVAHEPLDGQVPEWLRIRLEKNLGFTKKELEGLSLDDALLLWDKFTTKPK